MTKKIRKRHIKKAKFLMDKLEEKANSYTGSKVGIINKILNERAREAKNAYINMKNSKKDKDKNNGK